MSKPYRVLKQNRLTTIRVLFFFFSQADVSWSINGVPKGIIKQSLGNVPIMVKSKLCNLHGLSPKELIEHHEEAEVKLSITELCVTRHYHMVFSWTK